MQKGYELWCSSVADKNRDFFLARATADCQGVTEKYAAAGDLAGMGMRMLMELEVPEKKDNVWCSTGMKMLNEISAAGFTGHSERATMPSILAALGVSKADRGFLTRRSAGAFLLNNKGRESQWTSGQRSDGESWGRLKNMKRRTSRRRST